MKSGVNVNAVDCKSPARIISMTLEWKMYVNMENAREVCESAPCLS